MSEYLVISRDLNPIFFKCSLFQPCISVPSNEKEGATTHCGGTRQSQTKSIQSFNRALFNNSTSISGKEHEQETFKSLFVSIDRSLQNFSFLQFVAVDLNWIDLPFLS